VEDRRCVERLHGGFGRAFAREYQSASEQGLDLFRFRDGSRKRFEDDPLCGPVNEQPIGRRLRVVDGRLSVLGRSHDRGLRGRRRSSRPQQVPPARHIPDRVSFDEICVVLVDEGGERNEVERAVGRDDERRALPGEPAHGPEYQLVERAGA